LSDFAVVEILDVVGAADDVMRFTELDRLCLRDRIVRLRFDSEVALGQAEIYGLGESRNRAL
jgi:hypothetical protein